MQKYLVNAPPALVRLHQWSSDPDKLLGRLLTHPDMRQVWRVLSRRATDFDAEALEFYGEIRFALNAHPWDRMSFADSRDCIYKIIRLSAELAGHLKEFIPQSGGELTGPLGPVYNHRWPPDTISLSNADNRPMKAC